MIANNIFKKSMEIFRAKIIIRDWWEYVDQKYIKYI